MPLESQDQGFQASALVFIPTSRILLAHHQEHQWLSSDSIKHALTHRLESYLNLAVVQLLLVNYDRARYRSSLAQNSHYGSAASSVS